MDGFVNAIGQGIGGFVEGSFAVAGNTVRGIFGGLNAALPGGVLAAVVFVVLIVVGWKLTTR
ncbi:MAG TPA: hypothetical protein VFY18_05725 [Candidatus Limnocylindrales bacterium]|nr:hypothetical protein [Candidatus Limnocylindrales bacterium]